MVGAINLTNVHKLANKFPFPIIQTILKSVFIEAVPNQFIMIIYQLLPFLKTSEMMPSAPENTTHWQMPYYILIYNQCL